MNATPTLEMFDPATLTVDINVRKDPALTADFVASIKEHGVMEPVIYAGASAIAIAAALLAGLPAARRATKVAPMVAIKAD